MDEREWAEHFPADLVVALMALKAHFGPLGVTSLTMSDIGRLQDARHAAAR